MLAVVGALGVSGCINPVAPSEERALRRAEERWRAAGIHDYTFEMRTSCFCGPEVIEWAIVEVRNDRVVSARLLDGTPLTSYGLDSRKSVDELFALAKRKPESWVADIDFVFDPELGYPVQIIFESKRNIADAGAVYEARNLRPV